ncbi:MAG: hypothetical protein ABSF10_04855, partial [Verrucomicrobiota bacterium]|jgi:hypothetical protein
MKTERITTEEKRRRASDIEELRAQAFDALGRLRQLALTDTAALICLVNVSAVTTNRPARVESNQPVNFRKFAFSFQKTPRNALLWSFLE